MQKKASGAAKAVGQTLAFAQHTIDRLSQWGFRKMRELGDKPEKNEPETTTYAGKAAKVGKSALKFLGTAGDAFYEKYDELKKEKK